MSYRTRKYFFRVIRYTFFSLLFLLVYVYSAQNRYLPAVAEYYTGEVVRKYTNDLYSQVVSRNQFLQSSGSESIFYDIADTITFEPEYMRSRSFLNRLQQQYDSLSDSSYARQARYMLTSSPALHGWINNQKSRFAFLFASEWKREVKNMAFVRNASFVLPDGKSRLNYNVNNTKDLPSSQNKNLSITSFNLPIEENGKTLGFLRGEWDLTVFFLGQLEENSDQVALFDSQGELLYSNSTDPMPLDKARAEGKRFRKTSLGEYTIVHSYPAQAISWYAVRISIFIGALFFAFFIFRYMRWFLTQIDSREEKADWPMTALQSAIALEEETLRFSRETQSALLRSRERENEYLRLIGSQLSGMQRFFEEEMENRKQTIALQPAEIKETQPPLETATVTVEKEPEVQPVLVEEPVSIPSEEKVEQKQMPPAIHLSSSNPDPIEVIDEPLPQAKERMAELSEEKKAPEATSSLSGKKGRDEIAVKEEKIALEVEIKDDKLAAPAMAVDAENNHSDEEKREGISLDKGKAAEENSSISAEDELELLSLGGPIHRTHPEKETLPENIAEKDVFFIDDNLQKNIFSSEKTLQSESEFSDDEFLDLESEILPLEFADESQSPLYLEEDLDEQEVVHNKYNKA